MAERHRWRVGEPLPESLFETIRQRVADRDLEASILGALYAMLDTLRNRPSAPQTVDLLVQSHRGSLEVTWDDGPIRERLVVTPAPPGRAS